MSNLKKILISVFAVVLTISLTACGSKKDVDKSTFIMAIDADPGSNVNTVTTSDRFGLMVVNAVYNPLYKYNGPDDIEYQLAESVDISDDELTYTMNLRKGVKWHDGKDFTAEDVVYTFETILSNPESEANASLQFGGKVPTFTATDDNTVVIQMQEAKPNALEVYGSIFMMPKHIYKDVTDFATTTITPVGTGAYKYEEYNEGESTVFKANADYFDGKPEIETLIFKVILDANARNLAMEKGEVTATAVLPNDVDKFDKDETSIEAYSEGRLGYMSFNFDTTTGNADLVKNDDFRKAVFYAIDKEAVLESAYISDEYSLNPSSFLPSTATYSTNDVEAYGLDLDKSKELLKSSKVTGAKLKVAYPESPTNASQAAVIQDNLKEIGVEAEITGMDPTAFYKNLAEHNGDFDLFLSGYIMTIDPDGFSTLFTSGSATNYAGVTNAEIDKLFQAGINETDPAKREAIYTELQEVFAEYGFFLPLTENKRVVVISKEIEGVDEAGLVPIYTFGDWSKLSYK